MPSSGTLGRLPHTALSGVLPSLAGLRFRSWHRVDDVRADGRRLRAVRCGGVVLGATGAAARSLSRPLLAHPRRRLDRSSVEDQQP